MINIIYIKIIAIKGLLIERGRADRIFREKIKSKKIHIKGTISTQLDCPGNILRTIENNNGDNKHIYSTACL